MGCCRILAPLFCSLEGFVSLSLPPPSQGLFDKEGREEKKKRKKTTPETRLSLHVSEPGLHICQINPSQDPFPLPVRDRQRAAGRQINRSLEQLVVRHSANIADFLQIYASYVVCVSVGCSRRRGVYGKSAGT